MSANSWGWARPDSEARHSVQVYCAGGKYKWLAISCCLPGMARKEWKCSRDSNPGTPIRDAGVKWHLHCSIKLQTKLRNLWCFHPQRGKILWDRTCLLSLFCQGKRTEIDFIKYSLSTKYVTYFIVVSLHHHSKKWYYFSYRIDEDKLRKTFP